MFVGKCITPIKKGMSYDTPHYLPTQKLQTHNQTQVQMYITFLTKKSFPQCFFILPINLPDGKSVDRSGNKKPPYYYEGSTGCHQLIIPQINIL